MGARGAGGLAGKGPAAEMSGVQGGGLHGKRMHRQARQAGQAGRPGRQAKQAGRQAGKRPYRHKQAQQSLQAKGCCGTHQQVDDACHCNEAWVGVARQHRLDVEHSRLKRANLQQQQQRRRGGALAWLSRAGAQARQPWAG